MKRETTGERLRREAHGGWRRGRQFFTRILWASVAQGTESRMLESRHLEVCDEAEACGEAVGARVQRRDEHRVENGCFAPPGLPQAVDICFFHLPWTAGHVVGKAEQLHDF